MTAIDVACPACDQQPGEECIWSLPVHERFHFERGDMAAACTFGQPEKAPSKEDFDRAVEESGIL